MDVIVIGGGISGMTTAYALQVAGHRVSVIERHATLAQEATFGRNTALLPSPLSCWFGPGVPDTPRWFGLGNTRAHPGLLYHPGWNFELRRWMHRWRAERKAERFSQQYCHLHTLSQWSASALDTFEAANVLEYEQPPGTLHLFSDAHDLKQAEAALTLLKELEYPHRLLDAAECRLLEPTIPATTPLIGGVFLPTSRNANCTFFTKRLKQLAGEAGVSFRLGITALSLQLDIDKVSVKLAKHPNASANTLPVTSSISARHTSPATREEVLRADAIVLAAGVGSLPLLAQSGLHLPVQPIRLHALTAPLLHEEHAPQFTLVDNKRRIVIARLNHQWIKITGTAVLQSQVKILQGADPALRTQALDRLIQAGYDWAAGAIKFSAANYWDGINLLSPDGLPIVSRTHHPRLYVNLAHGPAGWGLSIGSAALITALLDNRLAKEDRDFAHMLSVDRFSR